MLKFVIGTAGTGKSTYITQQIITKAKMGEKCLLLVPEQFSKTGENLIFSNLDNAAASLVGVYSFTSLLADVQSNHVNLALSPLTAAGKAVMARRAMMAVEKMLRMYTRQVNNFNFSFTLTGTFDDLKRSGYDSDTFFTLVNDKGADNAKLRELALMYTEYTGLMGDKFCDHEDLLAALAENLPGEYLNDVNIYIDGFESFSYGQKKIIARMLSDAKDVTIALTCDSLYDVTTGTGSFAFVQQSAQELISLAKQTGVAVAPAIKMTDSHRFLHPELKNIDLFLQGEDIQPCQNSHAFIHTANTQAEEVAYVLAQINKLVQQGYNYNDIALVCPQLDKYENQLQESFALAKIPYFIDCNRIISSSAPVIFFGSVLDIMANGLDSETIMPLLKTGLTKFADEDIQNLENYLFTWQDYSFDLSMPFVFSAKGLKPQPDPDEAPVLEGINSVRQQVYDIFAVNGMGSTERTAGQMLTACWQIADALGAMEKAAQVADSLPDGETHDVFIRAWDAAIDCLNELYTIMNDDVINQADLHQLYQLIVEGAQIGFAPETQDCVMISQPKRMKLDSVKAVFILGAAQDYFPALATEPGLITAFDRESLKIKLNSDFKNQYSFENLYFYKALTTAREHLFITCAKKNIDLKQTFAPQVENLRRAGLLADNQLKLEDYAITKEFFTDYISSQATNANRQGYIDLLAELDVQTSEINEKAYSVQDIEYLEHVLGNKLTLSPSNAENFYKCSFMYLIQNILKVKPLEKAEFSARIAGNYLHFIAQKVMEKYGEEFYAARWDDVQNDIDTSISQFLQENYPQEIYNDVKFTAQYENMRENAVHLMRHIYDEQQNSAFRPIAFEQKIGDGGVQPLHVETGNGKAIDIGGICDRVDIYRGENKDYLRIVDYKTGTQNFKLDDVYNGLSSQLLLYMNALLNAQFGKGEKELAAGAVLYQHSDVAPKFDDESADLYDAVGMALSTGEISRAFDRRAEGRYGVIKGDTSVKSANRGSEVVSEKKFEIVLDYVKDSIIKMGDKIYNGEFDALPLADKDGDGGIACKYCSYKSICLNLDRAKAKVKNEFNRMEEG